MLEDSGPFGSVTALFENKYRMPASHIVLYLFETKKLAVMHLVSTYMVTFQLKLIGTKYSEITLCRIYKAHSINVHAEFKINISRKKRYSGAKVSQRLCHRSHVLPVARNLMPLVVNDQTR